MAIQSFADAATQVFFETGAVRKNVGWRVLKKIAARKLDMLHYAQVLEDLRSPPGNRLEQLKGPLKGLYSIRMNNQWRIVFAWTPQGPSKVRMCDYH